MSPSPRQGWQQLARSSWLFFPFTSASPHDNKDAQQQQSTGGPGGTGNGDASSDPQRSLRSPVLLRTPPPPPVDLGLDLDTNAAIALAFLLGSVTALGASTVHRRFFKRIRNAEWITPDLLKRKRWITGIVTSVGDADNFRLYHTPGFGWRGLVKFRHVPLITRRVAMNQNKTSKTMQNDTIHIRLAGMDAPEGAHFGRTAQPHYPEALAWLKENIEGRRIKCELLKRDQYGRVVALPLLPRSFRPWRGGSGSGGGAGATTRNLPLEMVRAGWGSVYTQKGAVYGSGWDKETYLAAEAEAQAARRGMWEHGTDIESPADYKKRYRVGEVVDAKVEEEGEGEGEPADERVGFWSRIFGRRKRAGDGPS